MLTYLLLAGPGLVGADTTALDRRVRTTAPAVLLQVGEPTLWTDDTGGCLLWTWDSASQTVAEHVAADEGGVLALAGTAWSRTSFETAASLARSETRRSDPRSMRDALTGSFSAVSLDRHGRGFVTTDATGTGHVYAARGAEVWAVSNRAPLAAVGLHGRWEPDVEAQAWMPMFAYFDPTSTSVRGVELVPASSAVVVAPGRMPSLEVGTTPWEVGEFSSPGVSEAFDAAAQALVEHASAVASSTVGEPVVNLSGGKDSRLILAAFTAAGRAGDVRFRTNGLPGAADREVATLLGDRYALDLSVHEPGADTGPSVAELDQRVRRHAFQTAGMMGAWDLQGHYLDHANVVLTGVYGELMRAFYRSREPLDSADQAIDHLQHKMSWDRFGLLRPHVRAAADEKIAAWAQTRLAQGWSPQSLLDLLYIEGRLRRWLGTAQSSALHTTANLLQLKELVVAGFAAGATARGRDELHYRLIERLDKSLLTVPLAQKSWDAALAEPDSRFNPTPVPSLVEGREAWQHRGWRSHRRLIAAELLATDNPLHEIVDPARVARVTARLRSPQGAPQLWALWAGSLWVSGGYEAFPWNGPSTPAVVAPSRVVAAASFASNSPKQPPAASGAGAKPRQSLARRVAARLRRSVTARLRGGQAPHRH